MKLKILIVFFASTFILNTDIFSQIKGEEPPVFNPDTTFIFKSPRPLIITDPAQRELKNAWGLSLLFSNNGFGLGMFYQYRLAHELYFFSSIYISGARKNDELDSYFTLDGSYYYQRVLGKKNRLFNVPLMFGIEKYFLTKELNDNLRPYAQLGIGPSFILSTPYQDTPCTSNDVTPCIKGRYYDFFESFGHAKLFVRWGGFIGIGANFESIVNSILGVNLRYYYIPFGGAGLESMQGQAITDFGGLFIGLNFGTRF